MNNIFRLFTLLGAGVVLGSVAGRVVRMDRQSLTRLIGIDSGEVKKPTQKNHRMHQMELEETENYFI